MRTMTHLNNNDTRNLLADISLFAGMTPTQLDWVAQRAHRRVFEAGRNVMTIEQPGEAVYIILYGTVKIHIEQVERDVILSILGAGDLLGEMSLIDSVGRSASAVTLDRIREIPELARPLTITQYPGGASNLTYLVQSGDREWVLRRPRWFFGVAQRTLPGS